MYSTTLIMKKTRWRFKLEEMCTQILVQYDLNLGGGSVPPHLPPTEPGSVPTKCIMKFTALKNRFEQAL